MIFSLVIPCYNEASGLPLLLERCAKIVEPGRCEIILVDNGSTDDTPRILKEKLPSYLGCRSVRVEVNRGYGFGILSGLRAAEGDILGWTHADMQTDPLDVVCGMDLFERYGCHQFVKGLRYGRPAGDAFFTMGMSAFESILLRRPLWDINAQPTMFSRQFFLTWRDPPHDFSLDLYAYYMAVCAGLPIRRFPVRFGERAYGVSHWNVDWKAKARFIRRTVAYSLELRNKLRETRGAL